MFDQREQRVGKQVNVAGTITKAIARSTPVVWAYSAGMSPLIISKFVGRDDNSVNIQTGTDLAQASGIYRQIEQRPDTPPEDKTDLKAEVEDVEAEVVKGEEANVSFGTPAA